MTLGASMLSRLRILVAASFIAVALLPSSLPGFRSPSPVLAGSGGCSPASSTCYLFDVTLAGSGFGTYYTIDGSGGFNDRIVCRYGNEAQTGVCGFGYELASPGGEWAIVYKVSPEPGSQACNASTCFGPGEVNDLLYITGNYAEQQWRFELIRAVQIDVLVEGTGSGRVTSEPVGIDCPGDCDDLYPSGLPVTLTAKPATGSVFTRWEGDCSGTNRTCAVNPEFLLTVTAVFNKKATPKPPTAAPTEAATEAPTEEPTTEPAQSSTGPTETPASLEPDSPATPTVGPTAESPTAAPSLAPTSGGANAPLIAGLAILLVALVAGTVFFARRGRTPAV